MPLPLKDRKIGAIEYVMKRIKNSNSYEDLKSQNEQGPERMIKRDQPESDKSLGLKQSTQDVMSAIESKDLSSLETALRSFISMMIDEKEEEEELLTKDD